MLMSKKNGNKTIHVLDWQRKVNANAVHFKKKINIVLCSQDTYQYPVKVIDIYVQCKEQETMDFSRRYSLQEYLSLSTDAIVRVNEYYGRWLNL